MEKSLENEVSLQYMLLTGYITIEVRISPLTELEQATIRQPFSLFYFNEQENVM
jgi:hypothetical protein